MKQGNGTDVLGLNDPRNASIGVIYVSPNDEKKNVLAAILTQEKLGRKQVAVVLPDQNKAFQRPGDFDDLKSLRGKLQTQIVFIAAGGPGPAAFARQRNFQVYSTLEIFAKALKDEKQPVQQENKKSWFAGFGSGKHKAVTPPPIEEAAPPVVSAGSFIAPLSGEEEPVSHNDHVVPLVLGGAVPATPALNGSGTVGTEQSAATTPPTFDDDWDALAPVAAGANGAAILSKNGTNGSTSHANGNGSNGASSFSISNGSTSNGNKEPEDAEGEGGPGIILLGSSRPKATVKLPISKDSAYVPLVVSSAKSEAAPRTSRNSGKVAAVGAGLAGGTAAASLASTAGVGKAPPPRAATGGGGSAGRPRRRGGWLLALAALLVLTAAAFASIAISAPSKLGPLQSIVPKFSSQSTINIVPDSKTENNNYLISGVPNNPDAGKREVSARVVTASSAAQSKTVNATGVKQTEGIAATGTITFKNFVANPQRIAITSFNINGVQYVSNASISVPSATFSASGNITAGSVTVNAHAANSGSASNKDGTVFYGPCCVTGTTAYVNSFSGGQDAQNYTFVQEGDIQGVATGLQAGLVAQAQAALKGQIRANEQIAGSTTCSPAVTSSSKAGDKATSVTVTVTATCRAEVYDQKGTLALVTNVLKTKATNDYGADYALVGNIVTQAQVQGVNKGIVSLLVSAKGVWAYQFTPERITALKKLIAGKSVADAVTILKGRTGIANASIDPATGTLPTNLDDIKFQIQPVTGLPGGGTSGGTNPNPTVTGPGTNPTTQPGLGVSGS